MTKSSRILEIPFLLATFLILPSFVFAATPTISNVTGTVATGQTLTITGTNMVQDNQSSWLNVSNGPNFQGTAYGFEGSSPAADGYCSSSGCSGQAYDTTVKLMGNKSLDFHLSGASNDSNPGRIGASDSFFFSISNYYGRFYFRYDVANNIWPTVELKLSGTLSPAGYVYVNPVANNGNAPTQIRYVDPSGVGYPGALPGGALVSGRWYCLEWSVFPGNNVTIWVDNQQVLSAPLGSFTPQFYEFGPINLGGTPSNFDMHNRFDAMAFKTSGRVYPASIIEISNNATYGSGAKVMQEPLSLSDGSIQIKANLTGLGSGPYYLWVTNNGQARNATGYNLSGGGGGDTTPPSAPRGLSVR